MNDGPQSNYMHIREAKKVLGVSTQTLHNWDKQDKIRVIRMPSGARCYHKEDVYKLAGIPWSPPKGERYVYCRVSSRKQVEDLERQKALLAAERPTHLVVTDIGSGLNWNRKGLQTILERALKGDVDEVVVAHRDRLCRFGFELLEYIFAQVGTKLIVLDAEAGKSSEQELAEDILAIIHVYSCKSMGRRRYANKKSSVVPNSSTETCVEEVDGNSEICL